MSIDMQQMPSSARMAEAAWQRVVDLHSIESSKRVAKATAGPVQDEAAARWQAHSKRYVRTVSMRMRAGDCLLCFH